jgi:hypothetical protein
MDCAGDRRTGAVVSKHAHSLPLEPRVGAVLAVDVGGSHVKVLLNGESERRRFASGPGLTPEQTVEGVRGLTGDWSYDTVSIGVPAIVRAHRVDREDDASSPGAVVRRGEQTVEEAHDVVDRVPGLGLEQHPGQGEVLELA